MLKRIIERRKRIKEDEKRFLNVMEETEKAFYKSSKEGDVTVFNQEHDETFLKPNETKTNQIYNEIMKRIRVLERRRAVTRSIVFLLTILVLICCLYAWSSDSNLPSFLCKITESLSRIY